jgi:hypothetical protein
MHYRFLHPIRQPGNSTWQTCGITRMGL